LIDASLCETHRIPYGHCLAVRQQLPCRRDGIFHRTFCYASHCSAASKGHKGSPSYHYTHRHPFPNAERYNHTAVDNHSHLDSHTPYRNGDANLDVYPDASDTHTDADIPITHCNAGPDGYALPIPGHPDAKRLPILACRPGPARSIAPLPQLPESAGLYCRSRL
jgi:hypothetical protein